MKTRYNFLYFFIIMTQTPWFFCRGVLIHFLFSLMQQLDSLYIKHFKLQVTLMLLNVISPLGEK